MADTEAIMQATAQEVDEATKAVLLAINREDSNPSQANWPLGTELDFP